MNKTGYAIVHFKIKNLVAKRITYDEFCFNLIDINWLDRHKYGNL